MNELEVPVSKCCKCGRLPVVQTSVEFSEGRYPRTTGCYVARLACKGRLGLWSHTASGWVRFMRDEDRKAPSPRLDALVPYWEKKTSNP